METQTFTRTWMIMHTQCECYGLIARQYILWLEPDFRVRGHFKNRLLSPKLSFHLGLKWFICLARHLSYCLMLFVWLFHWTNLHINRPHPRYVNNPKQLKSAYISNTNHMHTDSHCQPDSRDGFKRLGYDWVLSGPSDF